MTTRVFVMRDSTSCLLDVWRRSAASLPQCREALAAADQNVGRAVANLLDSRTASTESVASQGLVDPLKSLRDRMAQLGDWKRRDTARLSVVFVSESALTAEHRRGLVPTWDRWPFWCSVPVTRFIDVDDHAPSARRKSHFGGYVRTRLSDDARGLGQLDAADGWFMAHWDARFVLGQLRHVGVPFSTLVFGKPFRVTVTTGDDEIDAFLASFDHGVEEIRDGARAEQLRTSHPDRFDGWPDRCTASYSDQRYQHAVSALGAPDMQPAAVASPLVDAVRAALAPHGVPFLCGVYRVDAGEPTSPAVLLDRVIMELGCAPIGPGWRPRERDDNRAILTLALETRQAYGQELLPASEAKLLVERFTNLFAGDACALQNGELDLRTKSHLLTPVLGTTFELGVAFVDPHHVGLLLVGDED